MGLGKKECLHFHRIIKFLTLGSPEKASLEDRGPLAEAEVASDRQGAGAEEAAAGAQLGEEVGERVLRLWVMKSIHSTTVMTT